MKNVGIIRKVDALGRIVLPKELREAMGIKVGTSLEFFVSEDMISLQKYNRGCLSCGSLNKVVTFKKEVICEMCLKEIKKLT